MMYLRVSIKPQYKNVLSRTVLHSGETLPLAAHQRGFIFNSLSVYCTWRSGEKRLLHASFLSSFFGVCPTLKLLKIVSVDREGENNEEGIQRSTGSALGPVS